MKNNTIILGGFSMQYLIHNLFGIETGGNLGQTSFNKRTISYPTSQNVAYNYDYVLAITEIPFRLIYKLRHPSNPMVNFAITSGITLDWINNDQLTRLGQASFVPSGILGFRILDRSRKIGRIELGIEYKYSYSGKYKAELKINNQDGIITSKFCHLSILLNYYFFNRQLE